MHLSFASVSSVPPCHSQRRRGWPSTPGPYFCGRTAKAQLYSQHPASTQNKERLLGGKHLLFYTGKGMIKGARSRVMSNNRALSLGLPHSSTSQRHTSPITTTGHHSPTTGHHSRYLSVESWTEQAMKLTQSNASNAHHGWECVYSMLGSVSRPLLSA